MENKGFAMYSKGVSVWFACKLCKSYFVQADDFVYHKRKSHKEEFQNMKYIVFEERDIPKQNWVSLLPTTETTEATQVRQIKSLLPPPTSTNNVNWNPSPSNEIIKRKRNIQITQTLKKDSNDHTDDNTLNSCFDLDLDPNAHGSSVVEVDVDTEENDPLQGDMSTRTDKQKTRNVISNNNTSQTVIQSTPNEPYVYLKRLNLGSSENLVVAPQSNRPTIHSVENNGSNRNHNTSSKKTNLANNELKVTTAAEAQELFKRIITSNSPATKFPPLTPTPATSVDCKFCSKTFNSTAEFNTHEEICRLKRQFNNIICVSCLLTFGSSDELNEHNCKFHSTSMSTSVDDVKDTQTKFTDDSKVTTKLPASNNSYEDISSSSNNILDFNPDAYLELNSESNTDTGNNDLWEEEFEFQDPLSTSKSNLLDNATILKPTASSSSSVLYKCKFCSKKFKSDIFQAHVKICKNLNLNQNQQSDISFKNDLITTATPILEDNFNYATNFVQVLKTEFTETETDGNDDSEFFGVDVDGGDPFQSTSPEETLNTGEILNVVVSSLSNTGANSGEELPRKKTILSRYCMTCKVSLPTVREYISHFHKFHRQNTNFRCTFPNCGRISTSRGNLNKHVMQVHSNDRPFKCPYPNCAGVFKSSSTRNRHFRTVHHKVSKSSLQTVTTTTATSATRINSTVSRKAPQNQKKLTTTIIPKTETEDCVILE